MMRPPSIDGPQLRLVTNDDVADEPSAEYYRFRLYVAGDTPKSLAAIANLRRVCALHLEGRHSIEVVDLVKHPELAAEHQILAVPTLVRRLPAPIKRVIGNLSDTEKVIVALEFERGAA